MKNIISAFFVLFLSATLAQGTMQNNPPTDQNGILVNEECLSQELRNEMKNMLTININKLRSTGKLKASYSGAHPLFDWPIIQVGTSLFNSNWAISNYVDQNINFPGQVTDYNCGTRSYDTSSGYNHPGVDIFPWPFSWYQMDNNFIEIVAAAEGQIIGKEDGQFDRNCNVSADPWNVIYIQHNDGSIACYGHMKNGSLTPKNIGDSVARGEYLGVTGSSGNSSGPHLHFEVVNSNGDFIDPYFGSCSTLNTDSWWVDQKPYLNTNINALLTHSAPPEFPPCPNIEIPNFSNNFEQNETVYFALYIREQLNGETVSLKIIDPNGAIFEEWDIEFTEYLRKSITEWSFSTLEMEGEWLCEATYLGQTISHEFNIGLLNVSSNLLSENKLYPNPVGNKLYVESNNPIIQVNLRDSRGRNVLELKNQSTYIDEIDLSYILKGIYFVTIITVSNEIETFKLIKN